MLHLNSATLQRGTKVLLDNSQLSMYDSQKVGVIGRNGCGKSSLFALIRGRLSLESGSISIPHDYKISEVSQQTPALSISALDYVKSGDLDICALLKQKDKAYAQNNGEAIALIEDQLLIHDYFTLDSRARILLHGLSFSEDEMHKEVKEFSGGQRMRLNLAYALIYKANLLLLDEPTNHLDLDTIIFLENYLKSYAGTIMCISHDRDFLDSFCTHILHFESQKLVMYTGNYSDYERLRSERIKNELSSRKKEEETLRHMQSFVERFRYKASKAKQAQSMLKAIDKLKFTAVTQEESPYHITFSEPERTVDILCDLKNLDCGYGEKTILKNINLMIVRVDRIGLLGRNGQGKSTLIKTILGQLKAIKGSVSLGKDLRLGYFAQHEMESLHEDLSALDNLRLIDKDAKEKDLRTFLGRFSFSGDKALECVRTFSGGEQARLALALIAYQKPNLLLLDEPTNHLDLEMREALTLALSTYNGALILVSHDRHLLEAIRDKLWLVENGGVSEFNGDLNDYHAHLIALDREYREKIKEKAKEHKDEQKGLLENVKNYKNREERRTLARKREELKPLKKEIAELEKKQQEITSKLSYIDASLQDESLYTEKKDTLENLLKERSRLEEELKEIEETWIIKQDEYENAMS